jgi:predicted dehydrogenase
VKNRRSFVKGSALVGASLPLFNIGVAGASPNEKVNHASFGASGMAFSDIKSLARSDRFNLVAVAEVDDSKLGKLLETFPDVKVYKDWRVLLDQEHKHLDSVNVSTPDHMHAPIAVSAMNLGLHVYGQKPLAQNLYETRRMAEIARERKLVTQMGIQLSSSTYERLVARMIRDGVIGKVKEVHIFSHKTWGDPLLLPDQTAPVPPELDWDLWCGTGPKKPYIGKYCPPGADPEKATPYYHPGQWRKRLDYGTGTLGDMGCHIYSPMFQALELRTPLSVKSVGGVPNQTNWAIDEKFEYTFPGNAYTAGTTLKVTWCDGTQRPPQEIQDLFGEKMPKQGGIFIGTEGVLLAPHGGLPVPYPLEKFAEYRYPKFPARDHYLDFIAAVRGEDVMPIADFVTYAGPLTETVLLGGLASRFPNETLDWDAANLRFTNNKAANGFIRKTYRKGWEVDGLS